jgi:hypothetical protein
VCTINKFKVYKGTILSDDETKETNWDGKNTKISNKNSYNFKKYDFLAKNSKYKEN